MFGAYLWVWDGTAPIGQSSQKRSCRHHSLESTSPPSPSFHGHHMEVYFEDQEWLLECRLAEAVMQMSRLQSLHIHAPLQTADSLPGSMNWKLLARHPALQNLDVSLFLCIATPVPTDLLSLSQLTTLRITSPHPKVIFKLASMTSTTSSII